MQVTFLGTAAATAMPLPFCRCETCQKARRLGRKDIRRRSALLLNGDLLIDLGPDVPAACSQYSIDLSKVQYILQTHAHSDHFDAGHLITRHPDYAVQRAAPATLAASPATLQAVKGALQREDGGADLFSPAFRQQMRLSLLPLSPLKSIRLGRYTVTALDSLHDPAQQALIFFIEQADRALLYATDLYRLSEENFRWLCRRKIDLLILDQTCGEGVDAGRHLNAGQAAALIGRLRKQGMGGGPALAYVTHISHEGNPPHREMQRLAAKHGYRVAYDGLRLHI